MRRALLRLVIALAGVGVLALVAVVAGWIYISQQFDRPGLHTEEIVVIVEPGMGSWQIADTLHTAGIIGDPNAFAVGVWREGHQGALKAGEFAFPAGITGRDAMHMLVAGQTVIHKLTVPEGLTSADVVALLTSAEALEGDIARLPGEGTLLPETYHFKRGETRASLLARMQAGMQGVLDELWATHAPSAEIPDKRAALVLASIIEKETAVAAERAKVAGVFLNRLGRGMPLQSDPTVIYAVTEGRTALGRALTKQDLAIESPYNTYRNKGLPPGAIANPGRDSIAAVLAPEQTDALYFVADGSGGHAFAKTLKEHNRNVARWRKLIKERSGD